MLEKMEDILSTTGIMRKRLRLDPVKGLSAEEVLLDPRLADKVQERAMRLTTMKAPSTPKAPTISRGSYEASLRPS